MDLKITGTVKKLLEQQSGESQNGPWRRQEFIFETEGNYPKEICIVQWGDKIDSFGVQLDERLTVSINIASREYNERWYTDVTAWRVERDGAGGASPVPDGEPFPEPQDSDGDDGLPF